MVENFTVSSIVFSSDLHRSLTFYKHMLGFCVRREGDDLLAHINNQEIRIIITEDASLAADVGVLIKVPSTEELYKRISGQTMPKFMEQSALEVDRSRFSLRDPDGNSLFFVEAEQLSQSNRSLAAFNHIQ